MGLRSLLYRIARIQGDLNALRRGPKAVVKRALRKKVLKSAGKINRKYLK